MKKAPLGEVTITVQTYQLPPQVQPPDAAEKSGKASVEMGGAKYVPIDPVTVTTSNLHYGSR